MWDKDDDHAMDFVAACSNIRSKIFDISQKTRFDIKSMAGNTTFSITEVYETNLTPGFINTLISCLIINCIGNIIPAIATTNAVIAGCIVMEALKILNGQIDRCKTVGCIFNIFTIFTLFYS